MIIVSQSAASLKRFLALTCLNDFARQMVLRMVLSFIMHRGRMSCSAAAGVIASESICRGQLTRFLARPRWQRQDYNAALRRALLNKTKQPGRFLLILDATMVSQAGQKTQNTYSTGNRKPRPRKGRRYNQKKVTPKTVHSFTFGLLITPTGSRIPFQIPHYTQEHADQYKLQHRVTAQAAAELIRQLPLPDGEDVVVLADTAYDAQVVREARQECGYTWIVPINPERVYAGRKGQRERVRSRLKDWTELSLKKIRLRPSVGPYAKYRRLSQWRVGPKQKPRVYYAHQEKREVHRVGKVQLVFSTLKPEMKTATPDDVKILMSNARDLSVREMLDLYSLRWQIELFFKELKSTLGFSQYRFQRFRPVEAWVETAVTTVLFLEDQRARRMSDRRLSRETRQWWERQRLHGLCEAVRQECSGRELQYLSARLKTSGGIAAVNRLLKAATPPEYRSAA